jgi:HEAT repeat protein/energy-coupling factor transporter ATP-binding protein EcfA2
MTEESSLLEHLLQDRTLLRRVLLVSGQGNVLQIGKYNIHLEQGQNLHIGDHIYQGSDVETLRQVMREVQAEIASDRYAASLQAYFHALRRYCAELPYLTLTDIRPPKNLDEVYVPLRARQRENEPLPRRPATQEEALTVEQVLRQAQTSHLLILGQPGAGKSTLLRQLAERAYDDPHAIGLDRSHLPLLLPLRALAHAEGALEARLNQALQNELRLTRPLPAGFLDAWPQRLDAPWLFLLDGLDEVPADRYLSLRQWISDLLAHPNIARVILTSRPSAYTEKEWESSRLSIYEIQPFTPDQTAELARRWFGEDAHAFLQALETVRSSVLTETPLLITIAAKVYLERKRLPERRAQLYQEFVDIWLDEARERGLRDELDAALLDLAQPALAHLALAMTEHPEWTDEKSLIPVVAEYLNEQLNLKARAPAVAERFLRVMARRSGVFLKREERYEWVHPTFREYLAAKSIEIKLQANRNNYNKVISSSMLADKAWREVIVTLTEIHKEPLGLLRWIAREVSLENEDSAVLLYSCWQVNRMEDREVEKAVIKSLVTMLRGSKYHKHEEAAHALRSIENPYVVELLLQEAETFECAEARYQAVSILATKRDPQGEELCIKLLFHDPNAAVRYRAADYLGRIRSVQAVEPLIRALSDHSAVSLRHIFWTQLTVSEAAAKALGKIRDSRATEELCNVFKTTERSRLKMAVTQALVQIGDSSVASLLISALRQRDEAVCRGIANALLSHEDLRSAKDILRALRTRDVEACYNVMNAWLPFYPVGTEQSLARSLQDESEDVRWGAALVLGAIPCLEEAGSILYEKAMTDRSEDVRCAAARALAFQIRNSLKGEIWGTGEMIVFSPSFPPRLECVTDDDGVHVMIVQTTLNLSKELALLLTNLLRKGNDCVRRSVLEILSTLPASLNLPAAEFVELIKSEDAEIRAKAAKSLGMIHDEMAVPYLCQVLLYDPSDNVRTWAAWALGILKSSQALDTLTSIAQDTRTNVQIRKWAIWALGEIGDLQALKILIALLSSQHELLTIDTALQSYILRRLSPIPVDMSEVSLADVAFQSIASISEKSIEELTDQIAYVPDRVKLCLTNLATMLIVESGDTKHIPLLEKIQRQLASEELLDEDQVEALSSLTEQIDPLSLLESENPYLKFIGISVMSLDKLDEAATGLLLRELQNPNGVIRFYIIELLSDSDNPLVVSALERISIEDPDEIVREAAREALARIRGRMAQTDQGGNEQ